MSFFLPDRLHCFICTNLIGDRVDAARLFFVHPDDVGGVARHGRAWVHRRCWNEWPTREAWARSAARLLTKLEDVETISSGFVVCRLSERDILLQDTWQAIEVSIPRDRVKDALVAFESLTPSTVVLKGVQWTFAADEHGLKATVEDENERFEVFSFDPRTWMIVLERVQLMGR
jgi:hypothetical protein